MIHCNRQSLIYGVCVVCARACVVCVLYMCGYVHASTHGVVLYLLYIWLHPIATVYCTWLCTLAVKYITAPSIDCISCLVELCLLSFSPLRSVADKVFPVQVEPQVGELVQAVTVTQETFAELQGVCVQGRPSL